MTARDRDQKLSDDLGFSPTSSFLQTQSKTMESRSSILTPQNRPKDPTVVAAYQMEKKQTLSSPPSAKGLRVRRVIEDLTGENARLRTELGNVQSRQERMVTDLVKIRSDMQAKEARFFDQQRISEQQNTDLEKLRRDISIMSTELKEARFAQNDAQKLADLQETVDNLTKEVRDKDLDLREKDQILRERDFELRRTSNQLEQEQEQRQRDEKQLQELRNAVTEQQHTQRITNDSQLDTERSKAENLQRELHELKITHAAALSQIETGKIEIKRHLDDLNDSRSIIETTRSSVAAELSRNEKYLKEVNQRKAMHKQLESQITAGEKKTQELMRELGDLQETHQKIVAETGSAMKAKQQLETDLAEARRMARFFKKNSEATSGKVKGLEVEIRNLKQSLQGILHLDEDGAMDSVATAGWSEPPGSWPDADVGRTSSTLRRKPVAITGL